MGRIPKLRTTPPPTALSPSSCYKASFMAIRFPPAVSSPPELLLLTLDSSVHRVLG